MPINTLGGGGSVSGSSPAAVGPFAVTVFTTPSAADYIYEVDVSMAGSITQAGVVMISDPLPNASSESVSVGASTSTTAYPIPSLAGRASPKKLKVGPSTPVTVAMYGMAATPSPYVLAYNYIGYKVT